MSAALDAMTPRRWQILAAVAALALAWAAAGRVAAFQSERGIAVLEPLGIACGGALLEGTGASKPVLLRGSFAVGPHGGSVLVQVTTGRVRAELSVVRGDEVARRNEVIVAAGEAIRLEAGLFTVTPRVSEPTDMTRPACVGSLPTIPVSPGEARPTPPTDADRLIHTSH